MELGSFQCGNCRFELNTGPSGTGLGAVWISGQRVRSGRLPLAPYSQSFGAPPQGGLEFAGLTYVEGAVQTDSIQFNFEINWRRPGMHQLTDYHLERVVDVADWVDPPLPAAGRLDLNVEATEQTWAEFEFSGFKYWWSYEGTIPLFWFLDRASWELDGNIRSATAWSQGICSQPSVTFADQTFWTTEERLPDSEAVGVNPVITQLWPRWMGHQAFDFQFKDDSTLIGVFADVALIRSAHRREPGGTELKTFDRHIFDETTQFSTTPKSILLHRGGKSAAQQRNLWSGILDEVNSRARKRFGMHEIPLATSLSQNFWRGHSFASYREDLLPAAIAIGAESVFIDNIHRSNGTERENGNQCQSHNYDVSLRLGGPQLLSEVVGEAKEADVRIYSWTSTAQSPDSPLYLEHRATPGWFVKMEDSRQVFGGTHSSDFQFLNLSHEPARRTWMDGLRNTLRTTGLDGYFLDMSMNVSYVPINYEGLRPTTQWLQMLRSLAELQLEGIEFDGVCAPFCRPAQAHHAHYREPESLFINHRLVCGLPARSPTFWTEPDMYRVFAYGNVPALDLFYNGTRVDRLFTSNQTRMLREFRDLRPLQLTRVLQEDDAAVIWQDESGKHLLLCNLKARSWTPEVDLLDWRSDAILPAGETHFLKPRHNYVLPAGLARLSLDDPMGPDGYLVSTEVIEEIRLLRGKILTSFQPNGDPVSGDIVLRHGYNDWEADIIQKNLEGKNWPDIGKDEINSSQGCIWLLRPAAFRYYMPAFLLASLTENGLWDTGQNLINALSPPPFGLGDLDSFLERIEGFTQNQMKSIQQFFQFLAEHYGELFDEPEAAELTLEFWERRAG